MDWTLVPYVRKSFYKHYNNILDTIPLLHKIDIPKDEVTEISINDEVYKGKNFINIIKRYVHRKAIKRTVDETNQAAEALFHNLNSLQSRSGNQLPFSSINYGTCTLPEGRMVIRALLKSSINGVGALHRTSVFPCCIFQVMDGVNKHKGEPNYDLFRLALKSTAQRLYPNYVNCDWSNDQGYDKSKPEEYPSTMGCRTYTSKDINGLGHLKEGRGNICPVTIILPTLAIECKLKYPNDEEKCVEEFMKLLNKKIYEAKDMLLERFEHICSQSPNSATFMYENNVFAGYIPEQGIKSALRHGSLALGQIGIAECLQVLIECNHTTEKGMELAKRIEQLFKDRCSEFKNEYKLNFGVYFTPKHNWVA